MFTTVLSENAARALAILGKTNILPHNSYLAGGTSLALHYGHRISIDFDFFTPSPFNGHYIADQLNKIGKFKLKESIEKNTLLGSFEDVKFSLFLYPYPLIYKPLMYLGLKLTDPRDIAAMKLAAIMDRGTKKDFIDLYFMKKKGIAIDQAFDCYEKKYGKLANNLYSLIKSLSFFDDADQYEMPEMIEKVDWLEVKEFFKQEVLRLTEKYLS